MDQHKPLAYVSNKETEQISRKVLTWLNKFPDKPVGIDYEYLKADGISMALSTIQGAYKTAQYIVGGYKAQYQFKVIYRLQPSSNNDRLSADELLNKLADWAAENAPDLGGPHFVRVQCDARSSLFAAYDDGSEDHQILETLIYEVI